MPRVSIKAEKGSVRVLERYIASGETVVMDVDDLTFDNLETFATRGTITLTNQGASQNISLPEDSEGHAFLPMAAASEEGGTLVWNAEDEIFEYSDVVDTNPLTQSTKLGVIGPTTFNLEVVADASFKSSPLEVLKLDAGSSNSVSTVCAFNNGDASNFTTTGDVTFDGQMKLTQSHTFTDTSGEILETGKLFTFIVGDFV